VGLATTLQERRCNLKKDRPLVIPIFIPHSGCPHQCAFCNQSIITEISKGPETTYISQSVDKNKLTDRSQNSHLPSHEEIRQEVERFLSYKGSREEVQLAFFGGTFLGLEPEEISMLLLSAQELADEKKIDSIRFSTRPDTITQERLELIASYPISTIEMGVQSMSDAVLKKARRGHTADDTIRAASLLRSYRGRKETPLFQTGMQMMVGLPGDSDETAIDTAHKIASLEPAFVRIYPLIVLEGSLVARWYREGRYTPLSLNSCVQLVKKLFLIFEKHNIPVIRMGLQASDLLQDKLLSMLAGPWHPAFGHLVYSELFFDRALDLIKKEFSAAKINPSDKIITLTVHPASLSRLRGDKNHNIKRLKEIYPSTEFRIRTDETLDRDDMKINLHSVADGKPI